MGARTKHFLYARVLAYLQVPLVSADEGRVDGGEQAERDHDPKGARSLQRARMSV